MIKKNDTGKGNKKKKKEIFVPNKLGDFEFETVHLSAKIFQTSRELNIKTLYSPSDQGIRGITKGLKSKNINTNAEDYRREQYKHLLSC